MELACLAKKGERHEGIRGTGAEGYLSGEKQSGKIQRDRRLRDRQIMVRVQQKAK